MTSRLVWLVLMVFAFASAPGSQLSAYERLEPAEGVDRTSETLAAIDRLREAGGGTLEFAPGEYAFARPVERHWWVSNHNDPMPRNVFLPIVGITNLTLRSGGARFVADGEGILLALVDVKNVTVRGISFDYVRPYFSEWTLRDSRLAGDQSRFPHVVENGKLFACGKGWKQQQRLVEFFDPVTRACIGDSWWDGSADKRFPEFPDGSVVVTRSAFRPNPTVFLYRGENVTFDECGVLSSAGIGLMAQRSQDVSVSRWYTRKGRYFTSLQADATHFSNCRGKVSVCDSTFEGMVDDAINVHSTCLRIADIKSPNVIRCRYMHAASVGFEVFLPGERLRFIRGETLEPGESTVVTRVEMLGKDLVDLTLADTICAGCAVGDAVENTDWQPAVDFCRNTVRNSKPRAALFTTPHPVRCESNLFERVASHVIELAGDARNWYESGGCRNVVIRDNVFRSCGKVRGKAMILIDPVVERPELQKARYHRNVLIERNRFEDFTVPLVVAKSVSNLVVCNNVVTNGNSEVVLRFSESLADVRGPEAWLNFMGGNVRKDGLRCDLESIKDAGISGVHFFHVHRDGVGEWPGCAEQVPCLSEKWEDVIRFLGDECDRLGLKLTVQNCPGWSQSGGPWIDLDHCQRDIEVARRDFSFGDDYVLPEIPKMLRDADSDWRDVCVLAFQTPAGDSPDDILKPETTESSGMVRVYRFARPVTVRSFDLQPCNSWNSAYSYHMPWVRVKLEVERHGGWREVVRVPVPTSNWRDYVLPLTVACGETTGTAFRVSVEHDYPISGFADPVFRSAARMTDWQGKSARTLRSLIRENLLPQEKASWVDTATVVDLTGRKEWTVPPGRWTVLRFGHVNAKRVNAPAPRKATGWECDKLDPAGIEANFNGYVRKLNEGVLKGKMSGMLVDSWECFGQTWTPKMERYFREANGYGLRPWLPTLFGWIVGSPAETEKFLWDWRRTNGDLITKNYYGHMAALAHRAGLQVYYETAFGDIIQGDLLEYWKYADAPMCEFWSPHASRAEGHVGSYAFKSIRPCASAAHVYGKKRVIAEAFTGWGLSWLENLRELKDVANRHFARGVTHLALQSYTHAPRPDDLPPGGCMGGYNGTPFTRLQTWWKHMPEFTGWLTRCEEFLEAGVPAQDVLWYLGDAIDHKPDEDFAFPEGFRADYLNHDVLTNRLVVKDGVFTIPEGTSWKVLWVPDERRMLPATRKRLTELAAAGGKVVFGGKDALVAALKGVAKDVATEPSLGDEPSEDFMWIHRRVDGFDRYFVAAGTNGWRGKVTFRAKGYVSIFDPVSCERTAWRNGDALEIPPSRSVFVEFGVAANTDGTKPVLPVGGRELTGWTLSFPNGWGAPEKVVLELPVSWTEIPGFTREAQAFSGTVTYETDFDCEDLDSSAELDLGRVESVAKVYVNGNPARTLWCEPYRCRIGGFVRKGRNHLRIEVTNTWRNRVIYDLGQPEKDRKTWIIYQPNYNPKPTDPFVPSGIIGPVYLKSARPGC